MIDGDVLVIGIQLELMTICAAIKCSMFNFVFDGKLFPGKEFRLEFYPAIEALQDNLRFASKREIPGIGALPLEQIDFLDDTPGIISLEAPEVKDLVVDPID